MNTDDFIDGVRVVVYHGSIKTTLQELDHPPGRRARRDLVELSSWYHGLSAQDKDRVKEVVQQAVYSAVFQMMAALDQVSKIDDEGTDLYLTTGDGTVLNENYDLHELFQITVDHELGYVDEFGTVIPENYWGTPE
jgi:hypothetical protein